MKKILFFFCAVVLGLSSQAQLDRINVEQTVHTDPLLPTLAGYTTYRLFAETAAATDFVTEVTGEAGTCTSTVCSDGDWFNSAFAGNAGTNGNSAFWAVFPDAQWDTYYTIGFSSSTTVGIPVTDDPSGNIATASTSGVNTAGAWTGTFAAGTAGSCIVDISDATGGAWFALNGDPNGFGVGANNSVLLGQFTTNGAFSSAVNVSVIDGVGLTTYTNCDDADTVDNLVFPAPGCTTTTACNYDAFADTDDGSCTGAVGDACDDGDAGTDNDVIIADCSCEGTAAAGDACADATALTVDAPATAGDNTGTTDENDATEAAACWGTDGADGDIWFSFDGTGGLVDITTDVLDTQIAVYDACGGNLVACGEDEAGTPTFSAIITGLCAEAGTTYYIEVEGWNGTEGAFTIAVSTSAATPATVCDDVTASNFVTPTSCDIVDNTTCIFPPANDNCATAEALLTDGTVATGDNTAANATPDDFGNDSALDVWYSFLGTGNTVDIETFANGGMTDSRIAVYEDPCGSASLASDDDGGAGAMSLIADFCTTAGTTYLVEVQGFGTTGGSLGSFDISVTDNGADLYCSDATATNYVEFPAACQIEDNTTCLFVTPGCQDMAAVNFDSAADADCAGVVGGTDTTCCVYPPANDACTDAEALTIDGGSVGGDNSNSTDENDATEAAACWGADGTDGDVWYSFVGTGGLVDITTDIIDTQIAVYDACGGNLVACGEDEAGSPTFSAIITGLCAEAGTTYFIEVEGWNGTTGAFTIEVATSGAAPNTICNDPTATNFVAGTSCDIVDNTTCVYPAIANDLLADAELLTMTSWPVCSTTAGTTVGATDSPESSNNDNDVWYEIIPSWAGIKIEAVSPSMDMVIQLYDNMGNLVQTEDATFGGDAEILFENIIPGDSYFISISDFFSADDTFTICAQNLVENALSSALWGDSFECFNNAIVSSSWLPAGQATEWSFDDGTDVTTYSSTSQQVDLISDAGLAPGTYTVQVNNVYEGFEVESRPQFSAGTVTINAPASALKGVYRDATVDLEPNALVRCVQATACGWESFNWEITDEASNVYIINTPTDVLSLSSIPGITYESTYTTRVAVVYGGGTTSDYGDAYDFNTGGVPLNKLKAQFNSSNTTLIPSQYIFAQYDIVGATDYAWNIQRTDVVELPFEYFRGAPLRSARVVDMGLQEGGTYNLQVRGIVAGFTSAYGAVEEVTVIGGALVFTDSTPVILGEEVIKEDVLETGVTMYPNPANEFVTLNITGIEEGTDKVLVDIFNSVGQLVQSQQISAEGNYVSTVVTLDDLSEGMYNVQLTIGNTVTTERIIIQK